jgi:hypothetical protein
MTDVSPSAAGEGGKSEGSSNQTQDGLWQQQEDTLDSPRVLPSDEKLKEFLQRRDAFDTEASQARRQRVIDKLTAVVDGWVMQVSPPSRFIASPFLF